MNEYRQRREKGLCGLCGREPRPGKTTCAKCAEASEKSRKKRERIRRKEKQCLRCGVQLAKRGKICPECSRAYSQRATTVSLGPELMVALNKAMEATGENRSLFIRKAIQARLERLGHDAR